MGDEGVVNPEGFMMLKIMAEDGDLDAQVNLTCMYFEGEGVNKNLDQAMYWSNAILANKDCDIDCATVTSFRMGRIYLRNGDHKQAIVKFTFFLDNSTGYAQETRDFCQLLIADAYRLLGNGKEEMDICKSIIGRVFPPVKEDIKKGAYILMGNSYLSGKEHEKALDAYNKGVRPEDLGEQIFLNNYGYANEKCSHYPEAMKYYCMSAELGCSFANLNIGYLYENGLGVEKNTVMASEYYEKGKDCYERWKTVRGI